MQKREEDPGTVALKNAVAVLLGMCVGVGVALAVNLLAAGMISAQWLGEDATSAITVAACLLGGFLGGWFALREGQGKAIVLSVSAAAAMFVVFLALGALFYQELSSPETWLPSALSGLCGGVLAGLTGKRRKKKRRK